MNSTFPQTDLSFYLKSISNLPKKQRRLTKKKSKTDQNLKIKDFYIEIADFKDLSLVKKIQIHRELLDERTFYEIKNKIDENCINCLAKANRNWYKIKIVTIDNNTFQLEILEKINDNKKLKSIDYLIDTIQKLKFKMVPKKLINKYISNFMEYNCVTS